MEEHQVSNVCTLKKRFLYQLTILAKHAVRYPLPEPTSSADAPSISLSLKSSKA